MRDAEVVMHRSSTLKPAREGRGQYGVLTAEICPALRL